MRVILVIGVGFWLLVGVAVTPIAYALAATCLILLGADAFMRLQGARAKQLDKRLDRWCNPVPLPESRRKKPRLVRDRVPAGRVDAAIESKPLKPARTAPGRTGGLSSDFDTKPDIRVSTRTSKSKT
ncbi:MAG: hypothetical protein ED559_07465 [Phycisphaera sp.]|nr:MAG: hypothetical protein ED559_07465 [Phycisphaera sp.]